MSKILQVADAIKIRQLHHNGKSKLAIGRMFGVSARTIGRIVGTANTPPTLFVDEAFNDFTVETSKEIAKPTVKPKKSTSKKKSTVKTKQTDVVMVGNKFFVTVISADGKTYTCDSSHPKFDDVFNCLKTNDSNGAIAILSVREAIKQYTMGKVTIVGKEVKFNGIDCNTSLTKRIVDGFYENRDVNHLIKFFERVMQNPSVDSQKQLFDFLEHNDIKINDNGTFTAWKRVRGDFKDFYTGTMDNSVGKVVSMSRNRVNSDKNTTCSSGLHVCAKSYLNSYHGGQGVIIACEVDPKDVVSIPTDYNNAKMRVCQYRVIGTTELEGVL